MMLGIARNTIKMREPFPCFTFFFLFLFLKICPWHLALQKYHIGMGMCARQHFEQCIGRAPLGEGPPLWARRPVSNKITIV